MYNFPWQQAAQATVNVPQGRLGGSNQYGNSMLNPQLQNSYGFGGSNPFGSYQDMFGEQQQNNYGFGGSNPFSYQSLFGQEGGQGGSGMMGSFSKNMNWGAAAGDLVDLIGGSPYDREAQGLHKIRPELQQYLNQSLGYLQPYQQAGLKELPLYEQKMEAMADPKKYYANLMSGYSESPDVQFQKKQGLEALQNTAAATGFTGSGQELKDINKYSQGVAEQGRQRYFGDMFGIDRQAMQALNTITGRGQQAGTQMGQWTMQTGQNIANLMSQIAKARAGALSGKEADWGNLIGNAAQAAALM